MSLITKNHQINFIEENENAIGYGSIGYKGNVVYAKIEGIEPTEKNALNDTYPITRYLHFFTSRVPKGIVKKFIEFFLRSKIIKTIMTSSKTSNRRKPCQIYF